MTNRNRPERAAASATSSLTRASSRLLLSHFRQRNNHSSSSEAGDEIDRLIAAVHEAAPDTAEEQLRILRSFFENYHFPEDNIPSAIEGVRILVSLLSSAAEFRERVREDPLVIVTRLGVPIDPTHLRSLEDEFDSAVPFVFTRGDSQGPFTELSLLFNLFPWRHLRVDFSRSYALKILRCLNRAQQTLNHFGNILVETYCAGPSPKFSRAEVFLLHQSACLSLKEASLIPNFEHQLTICFTRCEQDEIYRAKVLRDPTTEFENFKLMLRGDLYKEIMRQLDLKFPLEFVPLENDTGPFTTRSTFFDRFPRQVLKESPEDIGQLVASINSVQQQLNRIFNIANTRYPLRTLEPLYRTVCLCSVPVSQLCSLANFLNEEMNYILSRDDKRTEIRVDPLLIFRSERFNMICGSYCLPPMDSELDMLRRRDPDRPLINEPPRESPLMFDREFLFVDQYKLSYTGDFFEGADLIAFERDLKIVQNHINRIANNLIGYRETRLIRSLHRYVCQFNVKPSEIRNLKEYVINSEFDFRHDKVFQLRVKMKPMMVFENPAFRRIYSHEMPQDIQDLVNLLAMRPFNLDYCTIVLYVTVVPGCLFASLTTTQVLFTYIPAARIAWSEYTHRYLRRFAIYVSEMSHLKTADTICRIGNIFSSVFTKKINKAEPESPVLPNTASALNPTSAENTASALNPTSSAGNTASALNPASAGNTTSALNPASAGEEGTST